MSIYSWGACRNFPDMEDHGRYGSIQDTRQGGLCFGSVDLYQEYLNLILYTLFTQMCSSFV